MWAHTAVLCLDSGNHRPTSTVAISGTCIFRTLSRSLACLSTSERQLLKDKGTHFEKFQFPSAFFWTALWCTSLPNLCQEMF